MARSLHPMLIAALPIAALLSICCCGDGCDDPRVVDTGTYSSTTVYKFKGAVPKASFPQQRAGGAIELTVYRDTEQFRFRYRRDGMPVEETWNCVDARVIGPREEAARVDGAALLGTNRDAP